jgi:DNA-binding MarR family transcriptional regulator
LAEIHTIVSIGTNKNINITNLAKILGVSKSAVSQTITKLVKKGFVEKHLSPETENEVVLILTEKGQKVFEMHQEQHIWLTSQLETILKKYPQGTINILSSLAVDLQKMWQELPLD